MPRRSKMVEMRYEFSKIVELNTYRDAEPTTRPSTKAEKLEKSEYPEAEHRISAISRLAHASKSGAEESPQIQN